MSWCISDVEEVKDIFGIQNHVGVGFTIWQNKEANGMVDLQQVKIWIVDDYRYLPSLYTYSIAECDLNHNKLTNKSRQQSMKVSIFLSAQWVKI